MDILVFMDKHPVLSFLMFLIFCATVIEIMHTIIGNRDDEDDEDSLS